LQGRFAGRVETGRHSRSDPAMVGPARGDPVGARIPERAPSDIACGSGSRNRSGLVTADLSRSVTQTANRSAGCSQTLQARR
jgi:hypothetical protein